MKLSVIIPVYKVERTLDRCIESVLGQCVDGEMELILVDDGSPDRCPQLCDAWKERVDSMNGKGNVSLHVFHKPNGGLSDARNKGLQQASGDLVTFVDSDDELAEGTLAPLVDIMLKNSEIDILEYSVRVHAGGPSEIHLVLPDKVWSSARDYWEQTEAWEHNYACNKIFRRSILDGMEFPVGRVFEDVWFYPELLAKGVTVATSSKGEYIYKWNEEGITVQADGAAVEQLLEAQLRARKIMHTTFFSRNGWKLYRSMLYRQIDVYRLTGKMLLTFPFCKTICKLHKWIRYR